jgi:hypothetical protein
MRGVDMPHPVRADLEDLAVGERHGRPARRPGTLQPGR